MVQRASSKTASTTNVPGDVQTLASEANTNKRRRDTDTDDAPSKKARQQLEGHETIGDVPGKRV